MVVIVFQCINVSNKDCTAGFQGAMKINKILPLKLCNMAALDDTLFIGHVLIDNL